MGNNSLFQTIVEIIIIILFFVFGVRSCIKGEDYQEPTINTQNMVSTEGEPDPIPANYLTTEELKLTENNFYAVCVGSHGSKVAGKISTTSSDGIRLEDSYSRSFILNEKYPLENCLVMTKKHYINSLEAIRAGF